MLQILSSNGSDVKVFQRFMYRQELNSPGLVDICVINRSAVQCSAVQCGAVQRTVQFVPVDPGRGTSVKYGHDQWIYPGPSFGGISAAGSTQTLSCFDPGLVTTSQFDQFTSSTEKVCDGPTRLNSIFNIKKYLFSIQEKEKKINVSETKQLGK